MGGSFIIYAVLTSVYSESVDRTCPLRLAKPKRNCQRSGSRVVNFYWGGCPYAKFVDSRKIVQRHAQHRQLWILVDSVRAVARR